MFNDCKFGLYESLLCLVSATAGAIIGAFYTSLTFNQRFNGLEAKINALPAQTASFEPGLGRTPSPELMGRYYEFKRRLKEYPELEEWHLDKELDDCMKNYAANAKDIEWYLGKERVDRFFKDRDEMRAVRSYMGGMKALRDGLQTANEGVGKEKKD